MLDGTKPCPTEGSLEGLIKEPEPLEVTTFDPLDKEHVRIMRLRKEMDDNRQSINANIEKDAEKQTERIRAWRKLDGALKMSFIASLPREVLEAVTGLPTAAQQYAEVVRRYQDEGLNEAPNSKGCNQCGIISQKHKGERHY